MLMREMKTWETSVGVRFLKRIGVKQGQTVMDWGCGVGHYSLPAAIVVGQSGVVHAIDRNRDLLDKLEKKAESGKLSNIRLTEGLEGNRFDLYDESVDMILLYDMLHYSPADHRRAIYDEARRVLKKTGVLSVYPKHVAEDWPADHFKNLNAEDVVREIEQTGFVFEAAIEETMSHDNSLVCGRVVNFVKAC